MPTETRAGAVRVSVAPGHDTLRTLLLRPWPDIEAASHPAPGGRGGLRELPGGLLIRKCRRGGALGKLLGDRFSSPRPAFEEMRLAEHLLQEGVGVAEVVGVRAEKSGLAWRLAVVTKKVEDAATLRDLVAGRAPQRRSLAAAVARAVRRMHDSGVWHADLNLQNILVGRDGAVRIIDLAGSRVKQPLPESARVDNIARLWRSLAKQRLAAPAGAAGRFLMEYFRRDRAAARRCAAACARKMRRHRLWWALGGR